MSVLTWYNRLVFGGVMAGLLFVGACGKGSGPEGASPGGPPEVAVVTLQEERLEITSELPGRTSAYQLAEIRPQVNGVIQKVLFKEGGKVKAGDPLYQLDPAPYQAAYKNAQAALTRSEANLPALRLKADRYQELITAKAVSQQEVDDIKALLKQAEAEIEANKAAVESAKINLDRTLVAAPISGRIGKSNVTMGALATAYQAVPLTTIQQIDPIVVDATQSSANLLKLKKDVEAGLLKGTTPGGAKVRLLLEDGSPYPLEGTLKFSDITVDPTTGSFMLRMVFPNPKHILLPGMYVRVVIREGLVERAVLAPQQGISRNPQGEAAALVVDDSGKVQPRKVQVVRAVGDKWLVSSGLKAGDRLIVEGLQRIRPGISVKAVPFGTPPKGGPSSSHSVAPPTKAQ